MVKNNSTKRKNEKKGRIGQYIVRKEEASGSLIKTMKRLR